MASEDIMQEAVKRNGEILKQTQLVIVLKMLLAAVIRVMIVSSLNMGIEDDCASSRQLR